MTQDEQITAAKDVLKQNGVDGDNVELFEKLVRGFTTKFIGMLTAKYPKLLEIVDHEKEDDPDAKPEIKLGVSIKVDMSDPKILRADYSLRFSEVTVVKDGDREKVDDGQEEMPLDDDQE